jgi:MinD superfamily P-loop ATPase
MGTGNEPLHAFSEAIMKTNISGGVLKDSQQLFELNVQLIDVDEQICLVCGTCVGICQANAMYLGNDRLNIVEKICTRCGKCVQICPVKALHQGVDSK